MNQNRAAIRPLLRAMFRGSSAVEQPTVNRLVVGSIPTRGATLLGLKKRRLMRRFFCIWFRRLSLARHSIPITIKMRTIAGLATAYWRNPCGARL